MGLPNEINPILLKSSSGGGGGGSSYTISRSLRFRASASAYLNRTPASSGSLTTWTFSCWLKRGSLTSSAFQNIFLSQTLGSSANYAYFGIDYSSGYGDGVLVFEDFTSSVSRGFVKTVAQFRDPSAWYHIVLTFDTTNATAENRIRIYVNGVLQTLTITNQITQNQNGYMNTGSVPHFIGCNNSNPSSNFFDGYLTEVNFIDGQALTPSSFGQTDSTTGVWVPKQYTSSYGTNGFYLNFSDNSAATAAAIGKDSSGNGKNWTPNNISVTSGITYDSMIDTPTPYDDGTEYGRGNYAVLNPLNGYGTSSGSAISQGNLRILGAKFGTSTIPLPTSGKWYAEATIVSASLVYGPNFGISDSTWTTYIATVRAAANTIVTSGSGITNTYGSFTNLVANDIIGLAFDATNGTFNVYRNNTLIATWSGSGLTGNPNNMMFAFHGDAVTDDAHFNFGQRPFVYTPPTGYKALNTQNLPTPTIAKGNAYMDATTYVGNDNGTNTISQSITGVGFQPDLVWIKSRSNAYDHCLFDSVRGATKKLVSNSTAAELSSIYEAGQSFNTDGFNTTVRDDTNRGGYTFVGWCWKEGATPGFDIVSFTAPSSGNFTINHGLGVAPDMVIVKDRSNAGTVWYVYHRSVVTNVSSCLDLNSTSGLITSGRTNIWGAALPTATTVGLNAGMGIYGNANGIAYCFASIPSFSKFGSYTGNGSADGPFVYCGFRPRFMMVKNYSSAGNGWAIRDTTRDPYNVANKTLLANSVDAEATSLYNIDFVSNGFKIRDTGTDSNGSATSYIFAAFAENPFKYALAR